MSKKATTNSLQIKQRCCWPGDDPLMIEYHDREWGTPVRDDRLLFEHLVLDGMQAGLSWRTILHKREDFRRAFDQFAPEKIARYGNKKIEKLMNNKGIIRNQMKINSVITNARAWLDFQGNASNANKKSHPAQLSQPFSDFLWEFVGGQTIHHKLRDYKSCPAQSEESRAMSKALKKLGFSFVGPTICYAFMQATGMVNDHEITCFRYKEIVGNDE